MARKSKDTEDGQEPQDEVVDTDSATVTWRGGTRTYTRAVHGDDFRALAEEFAGKKGGVVV